MAGPAAATRRELDDLTRQSVELTGASDDYDQLLERVGSKRFVLLGEASHGTHEFYRERARITKRLIEEKGFTAVAVEADWPDAYRVNRYVLGESTDVDAQTALADFRRFPAWMWRNTDVVSFVEWLRARNDAHSHSETKVRRGQRRHRAVGRLASHEVVPFVGLLNNLDDFLPRPAALTPNSAQLSGELRSLH